MELFPCFLFIPVFVDFVFKNPGTEKRKGTCCICIRYGNRIKVLATPVRIYSYEWDEETKKIKLDISRPKRYGELLKEKELLEEERDLFYVVIKQLQSVKKNYTLKDILILQERWKLKRSFFSLVLLRIEYFKGQGKDSTAENYSSALKNFQSSRKSKDLAISELSINLMKDFQRFMKNKGLQMNTISLYMRHAGSAYNYALDEELIEENRRPFHKVFTGVEKTRKRAVKEDTVKQLISMRFEQEKPLELARDMFLFSIFTQGMVFVDVAHLSEENIRNRILYYKRHKTGQQLEIFILPCVQEIINKYGRRDSDNPYLFPILYNEKKGKPIKYHTARREYNTRLRLVSERLGLAKPLSSHCFRHICLYICL